MENFIQESTKKNHKKQVFITELTKDQDHDFYDSSRDGNKKILHKRVNLYDSSIPKEGKMIGNWLETEASVPAKLANKNGQKVTSINKIKSLLKDQKKKQEEDESEIKTPNNQNINQEHNDNLNQKLQANFFRQREQARKASCGKNRGIIFKQQGEWKDEKDINFNDICQRFLTEDEERFRKQKNINYQMSKTEKSDFSKGRGNGRKKCQITTQEQFQQSCEKYITAKHQQEVEQVFRTVNRQMQSLGKVESNDYKKLRKQAIKKINYMSYNQKYYEDEEVAHLNRVIQSCNFLIHKRGEKTDKEEIKRRIYLKNSMAFNDIGKNSKLNQLIKDKDESITFRSSVEIHNTIQDLIFNYQKDKILTSEGKQQDSEFPKHPRKIGHTSRNSQETQKQNQTFKPKIKRLQSAKMARINTCNKKDMNERMDEIIKNCSDQKVMIKQVKKGLKIFEYYCGRLQEGLAKRSKRIDKSLKNEVV